MAKKKFINQLYRKNKSSMVTSKMLQEQSVNAILADSENRTLWINGSPYGNAYVKPDTNNDYDRLDPSNKDKYGPIHAEIFNDFDNNTAEGDYSHAEGKGTQTYNEGEHAEGKYNYSIKSEDIEICELDTDAKKSKGTISTIGIGTNEENRKNAFRVDNSGEVYIVGVESTLPDGRKVSYDPCTYDGTKKTVETRSLQEVIQGLGTMQEVTYGELRTLIDNKRLIPGMQYRITNYGSLNSDNKKYISDLYRDRYVFNGNQFDIIVVADSEDKLNKNARACHHDFENDIKYIAENIINSDPYINDNIDETNELEYVSYKNYLKYKRTTTDRRAKYRSECKQIYNKIITDTAVLESKSRYLSGAAVGNWNLQYDINNSYGWVNNNYDLEKIRINVQKNQEEYELREYIFDSKIDTYTYNNVDYNYKWRLNKYQKVASNKVYDFIDNNTNPINIVEKYDRDNTEYDSNYDKILLTEIQYPNTENTGNLFFGEDNKLFLVGTDIQQYIIDDIVLLNISYPDHIRNFLYSGTTYYKGEKVYKWHEIEYIDNLNNIIGIDGLTNDTFETSNCNIKEVLDPIKNIKYRTYILSKSLTPLVNVDGNQIYITGKTGDSNIDNKEKSFIDDRYFREYLTEPQTIDNISMYKIGYCNQLEGSTLFDTITIFKKINESNTDFNIHYNLTDEVYEYTDNTNIYYYTVWSISDQIYSNQEPEKICVGNLNNNYAPYTGKDDVLSFINELKSLEYNNIDYGNNILNKLSDALSNQKLYTLTTGSDTEEYFYIPVPENIPDEEKDNYNIYNYEINTLVYNKITFNYEENGLDKLDNIYRVISNDNIIWNNSIENIPNSGDVFSLFKKYYNSYKQNNIENINLSLYNPISSENNKYKIYSDNDNNIYIYYSYTEDENINILGYTNFKYINKYYPAQGVITYLCDEYNNECNYDFKNIRFALNIPVVTGLPKGDFSISDFSIILKDDNTINFTKDDETKTVDINTIVNNNFSAYKRYCYTFTNRIDAGEKLLDNSLSGKIINTSILNNDTTPTKNVFIDCVVKNNKILNSSGIIFYQTYFYDNIINNCSSNYLEYNIYNTPIYYGAETGTRSGLWDSIKDDDCVEYVDNEAPRGILTLGSINFENNIINNSTNIHLYSSYSNGYKLSRLSQTPEGFNTLTLGLAYYNNTVDIDNDIDVKYNKLYNYNNIQIDADLRSAVLIDNKYSDIQKKSKLHNTIFDIPSIKTLKSYNKNILNISHDNIYLSSSEDTNITSNFTSISSFKNTNISSSENTNISSSKNTDITSYNDTNITSNENINIISNNNVVFIKGNIQKDKSLQSLQEGTSNDLTNETDLENDEYKILYNNINMLPSTFNIISNYLVFDYDYEEDNDTTPGKKLLGVGYPSQTIASSTENPEYWYTNPNNTFQATTYCKETSLIKPQDWPQNLYFPISNFLEYRIDFNNIEESITDTTNKKIYKLKTATITKFTPKDTKGKVISNFDTENDLSKIPDIKNIDDIVNELIDLYPSFWMFIQGFYRNPTSSVNFIMDCTYNLHYSFDYYHNTNNNYGTDTGSHDILSGASAGKFDNYFPKPTQTYKNFSILAFNSLNFIKNNMSSKSKDYKGNIKMNLIVFIRLLNNQIDRRISQGYRINNIKIGINVEFNNIGASLVLGSGKYRWFNIQPLHSIPNNIIDLAGQGNGTGESKLYENLISNKYTGFKLDNMTELYYYIYNLPSDVSTHDNEYITKFIDVCTNTENGTFSQLAAASDKGYNKIGDTIKTLFEVNAYKIYDVTDINTSSVDSDTNGVYIKQTNDNRTELSVEQTMLNDKKPVNCYIKLTYDESGYPSLVWWGPKDTEQQKITLDKLLTIK